jgi:hypothetical protein
MTLGWMDILLPFRTQFEQSGRAHEGPALLALSSNIYFRHIQMIAFSHY